MILRLFGRCNVFRLENVHLAVLFRPYLAIIVLELGVIVDNANEACALLVDRRCISIYRLYDSYGELCGSRDSNLSSLLPGGRSAVVALAQRVALGCCGA